jgi:hypothetical protein
LPDALNAPAEILLAGVAQHHVQLRHRLDRQNANRWLRRKRSTSTLDAALLMRALQPDRSEQRRVEVVRSHRDEPVGLHAPAAPLRTVLIAEPRLS